MVEVLLLNCPFCPLLSPISYSGGKTRKLSDRQMNKGGEFLKKLWCCVGGRVEQVI